MPLPDDEARLRHILEAARTAVRIVTTTDRSGADTDEILALALVRLLEIIGKAAAGVTETCRARHPGIPWRQMSDTRNRLIHGYFDVNYDVVRETVTTELPSLIVKLEKAIKTEGW